MTQPYTESQPCTGKLGSKCLIGVGSEGIFIKFSIRARIHETLVKSIHPYINPTPEVTR